MRTGEGRLADAAGRALPARPSVLETVAMWHAPRGRIVVAQLIWDWELILTVGGLACLIWLGLWCILKVKGWGRREDVLSAQEQLKSLQLLREQGLLTQEEFDRIRAALGDQSPAGEESAEKRSEEQDAPLRPVPAPDRKEQEPPSVQP